MAGIDKTYLNNWEDYEKLREWCKDREVKFHGFIPGEEPLYASDFLADYTKEEFEEIIKNHGEVVIWNTPTFFDIFLIRNCPFDFIQNRLKQQYSSDYENIKSGNSVYDKWFEFRKSAKKVWRFKMPKRRPNYNDEYIAIDLYNYSDGDHGWKLYWNWDWEKKIWVHPYDMVESYCSSSYSCDPGIKGKGLAKKIKSWNIPEGTIMEMKIYNIRKKKLTTFDIILKK